MLPCPLRTALGHVTQNFLPSVAMVHPSSCAVITKIFKNLPLQARREAKCCGRKVKHRLKVVP
eukprot:scaffold326059_cov63-Tisochrysis_lutea.AAC.1